MTEELKYFCYIPWIHSQVTTTGKLSLCCNASPNHITNNGDILSVQDYPSSNKILNSDENKKIRKLMLKGIAPKECSSCWTIENSGGCSPRNAISSGLAKHIDSAELIEQTTSDGTVLNPRLRYLELRLGNNCNLKCRFCGPHNSSSWYADHKKLYDTENFDDKELKISLNNHSLYEWPESNEFDDWFINNSQDLINLQFAGGEPLLSRQHKKIIDSLTSGNKSQNINLIYTTNGTILPEWLFDSWSKFKSVLVYLSIEGIEKNYNYQRWPGDWNTTEQNIQKLKAQVGLSITKLTIQPHINIYNIASISRLAEWTLSQGKDIQWNKHINFLTQPSWQSAYVLTKSEKKNVVDKIQEDTRNLRIKYSTDNRLEMIIKWLEAASVMMLNEDWSHLKDDCHYYNNKLDVIRNCHARDYLDEMTIKILSNELT